MDRAAAEKRHEELVRQIERSNHLYYDLDAPELSDYEYDALTREARALEAQYPELATATSPTQRVGGTASGKFEKVQHAVRMESLQDVFGIDEVLSLRHILLMETPIC